MTRSLRSGARQNRDRLPAAALELFASAGADVSLEAIAKRDGLRYGAISPPAGAPAPTG